MGFEYSPKNLSSTLVYGAYDTCGRLVGSVQPLYASVWDWSLTYWAASPMQVIHGGIDCPLSLRAVVGLAGSVLRDGEVGASLVSVHRRLDSHYSRCLGWWVHDGVGGVEFLSWADAYRRVVMLYGMGAHR